jgi:hypothetical protein
MAFSPLLAKGLALSGSLFTAHLNKYIKYNLHKNKKILKGATIPLHNPARLFLARLSCHYPLLPEAGVGGAER